VIHYLDTHILPWLYENDIDKLTRKARAALERSDLLISPMVLLELEYLYEIGRILIQPQAVLLKLQNQIGLRICDLPFQTVISAALYEAWTRDPFDRIIVAHAKSNEFAPLITSDAKIQRNYAKVTW
jgi:PIN domain nuclease of toxin-antitoxin system